MNNTINDYTGRIIITSIRAEFLALISDDLLRATLPKELDEFQYKLIGIKDNYYDHIAILFESPEDLTMYTLKYNTPIWNHNISSILQYVI